MSYFGSQFPEGISPNEYQEIASIQKITCPLFRQTALKILNSTQTSASACLGCNNPDAVIIVLDSVDATERLFVRKINQCLVSPTSSPSPKQDTSLSP